MLLLLPAAFASPWCGTAERLPALPTLPVARPRARAASEACVDPGDLAELEGVPGTIDSRIDTAHFAVAYDSSNSLLTEDALAVYTDALEYSWEAEIDGLGWQAPDQSDACLMTIILADFGDAWTDTGGYTNISEIGGAPYIILNTDWLVDGIDWTTTLIAHEFNHASQFSYNVYWSNQDYWFWESTAEWMADEVYDDANTYTYSLWSYLDAPFLGIESTDLYVDYGHFVFVTYLDEFVDADTPRSLWASAGEEDHVGDVLDELGVGYDDSIVAYTSHVAAIDFSERDVWLEAIGYFEVNPYVDEVSTYPAEGTEDGKETPQERGQNFLHLGGTPGGSVAFAFAGEATVEDAATAWVVTLATRDSAGTVTHTHVAAAEDGTAALTIDGLGEGVSDAYIGVVPLGEIGEVGASWSWSASVVPGDTGAPEDTDLPDDTGAPDTGDDGTGGGGKEPKGQGEDETDCGCAAGGAAPGAVWLAAVALGAVTRRRRRSW